MRMGSATLLVALLATSPAFASQGDGAKAEDVRRAAAQACAVEARYRPQCLDWFAPPPARAQAAPGARR